MSPPTTPEIFITGDQTRGNFLTYGGVWIDGTWNNLAFDETTYAGGSMAGQVSFDGDDVYIAGTLYDASFNKAAGYWKNGVWNSVDGAVGVAVEGAGGKVYVAGYTDVDVLAAYWVDGIRHDLSYDSSLYHWTTVTGLLVAGNDALVVAYLEDKDYTVSRPVTWVNGVLSFLSTPADYPQASVGRPTLSGHDVYIPGVVSNTDYTASQAGYWKNGQWNAVESTSIPALVVAMKVRAGQPHLTGNTYHSEYAVPYKPVEWVNGTESDLSFGTTDNTGYATGVALVGDDTDISGISTNNYYNAGTVGYWKNGTWTTLPTENGDDIPTYAIGVR